MVGWGNSHLLNQRPAKRVVPCEQCWVKMGCLSGKGHKSNVQGLLDPNPMPLRIGGTSQRGGAQRAAAAAAQCGLVSVHELVAASRPATARLHFAGAQGSPAPPAGAAASGRAPAHESKSGQQWPSHMCSSMHTHCLAAALHCCWRLPLAHKQERALMRRTGEVTRGFFGPIAQKPTTVLEL